MSAVVDDTKKRSRLQISRRALLAVTTAVLVGVLGAMYIISPKASESTDNAYIQADSSVVAPKVRGLIADVLVQHNQAVKSGDPLVRISAEEFDARVAASMADLQNAQASFAAAEAALLALNADEELAASTVRAARVSIRSADAQRERADTDHKRYENLLSSGAVSRIDADRYRATAISAQADAERSRALYDVSRNQASVTHAKRPTLQANVSQAEASIARAKATLNLALQDQAHTLIVAPIDGIVADRQVARGDYVQPGTRLLTLVPMNSLYVVANFKETQTTRMVAGQSAQIEVDALPGVTFKGSVESFAPGSGSQFSLMPFEPGTGNFTKVVQRVPVRIRFDAGQPELAQLRPGLSTSVKVRLQN
jgi:membrane fusion protein, multidrug efflux system